MLTESQTEPEGALAMPAQLHVPGARLRSAAATLLKQARSFLDLLSAMNHPVAAVRERNDLITRRVRLIAGVFAVLTLAWIPIDQLTVRWPYWGDIMLGRVVVALAFLGLALRPARWTHLGASIEVTMLVTIPLGFFLYTNQVLSISGFYGSSGGMLAVSTAYFYLPFVVAVGLSIFPLTALEAALPAGLAIAAMAFAVEVWPQFLGGQSGLATVWRIVLTAGIASLAGMSQLRFLLRLIAATMRDRLTGLLTRQVGEELLAHQFAYAQRQKQPFAVLFIDVDRFKSVNDRFGHKAGDAVLSRIGRILSETFRSQDVMIRWGGEEFVIGLSGADAKRVEAVIQRLSGAGLGHQPDGAPVTASMGVAERNADGVDQLRAMIELADRRMYESKNAGRNRYCFRGEPRLWQNTSFGII